MAASESTPLLYVTLSLLSLVASASGLSPPPPPASPLNCPCLTSHPAGVPRDGIGQLIITDSDGLTHSYPLDYGLNECAAHDSTEPPYCDVADAPAWCGDFWCYVDPNDCNVASSSSSYVPGHDMFYSYAACSSTNRFDDAFDALQMAHRSRVCTGFTFGIALPIIWLLPVAVYIFRSRRQARRAKTASSTPPVPALTPTPSGKDILAEKSSDHSKNERQRQSLDGTSISALTAAEKAGNALRMKVSGVCAQVGWILVTGGVLPLLLTYVGACDTQSVAGSAPFYAAASPWGFAFLLLALRPIDAAQLRYTIRVLFCFLTVFSLAFAYIVYKRIKEENYISAVTVTASTLACGTSATLLGPAIWPCCRRCGSKRKGVEPMAPRLMLHRAWLAIRMAFVAFFGIGLVYFIVGTIYDIEVVKGSTSASWLALAISFLLAALICTKSNRGHFIRRLGARGKGGSTQQEAASVASLMGDHSAAELLVHASRHFRGQPLNTLTREHLLNNASDHTILHDLTRPAAFGEVAAFVSHSWNDDGPKKFDKLHEWAKEFGKGENVLIWLDKSCIDQMRLDDQLACLPVFLAGCEKLVVLAGETYATRLWCCLELFVHFRMGGKAEDSVVKLLSETHTDFIDHFVDFNASKAKCHNENDRQRLLATIEASFGTTAPFDRLVREIFDAKVFKGELEMTRKRRTSFSKSPGAPSPAGFVLQKV